MLLAHSKCLAPLRGAGRRAALPIGGGTSKLAARRRVVAAAQGMPGEKEQHPENAVAKAATAMLQRELQRLHSEGERFTTDLAALCTPKQAGDFADWALMIASTVVFTWVAMQLYRVYLFLAYPHLLH